MSSASPVPYALANIILKTVATMCRKLPAKKQWGGWVGSNCATVFARSIVGQPKLAVCLFLSPFKMPHWDPVAPHIKLLELSMKASKMLKSWCCLININDLKWRIQKKKWSTLKMLWSWKLSALLWLSPSNNKWFNTCTVAMGTASHWA